MKESDIIIVDTIPSQVYYLIIKESAMYALISIPFTINRMKLDNLEKRIENITKGKIAEKLFEYFCLENSIIADFKTTSTPFYKPDNRDFILNDYEWDIKNNFIHHDGNVLTGFEYKELPALIPDRHNGDQWSKRKTTYFKNSKGVRFLFTFLKATDKNSTRQFIKINLSQAQKEFLLTLIEKYRESKLEKGPFNPDWFWRKMKELKDDVPSLEIKDLPNLIITGFADQELFDKFKVTNSGSEKNFINFIKPQWYQAIKKENINLLKFMNGTIWTRIPNATLPVSKLKPFKL